MPKLPCSLIDANSAQIGDTKHTRMPNVALGTATAAWAAEARNASQRKAIGPIPLVHDLQTAYGIWQVSDVLQPSLHLHA